jgi:hypothetical protein
MEIRDSVDNHAETGKRRTRTGFGLRLSLLGLLALAGCGVPGEPQPRRPPVPVAVTDLSARQLGDSAWLRFTLPREATGGQPLAEPPTIEIFRAVTAEGATPKKSAARLVYTIPSALVDTYVADGRFQFADPVPPEEIRAHPDAVYLYFVRTRASKQRASADSNSVSLRLYPVAEHISGVQARVTEQAIELSWPAPARMSTGTPLSDISGYRVYRAEIEPASAAAAAQDLSKATLKTPLELRAPSPSTSYSDTQFEFGRTYLYSIRSVTPAGAATVESADSSPVVVMAKDVFPPAPPHGLVVIFVPASSSAPAHAELSWEISPETDLAGYHVYRSEQEDTRGALLTPDLLLAPAFRDMSVVLGHHYFYRVTALDRAGNESEPGNPAALATQQGP